MLYRGLRVPYTPVPMTTEQANEDSVPVSPRYRRVLLKLSGEAFQSADKSKSLDPDKLADIAHQLKDVQKLGGEIAVVVGGGNIFRGLAGEKCGIGRTTGDHMGMLATVINALALQSALEHIGLPTRVMTAFAVAAVAEPFIRRKAIRHLERGRVVIFGAGTGNPYLTTDTAAALRANEIDCDILMKATKVDGIYDRDPKIHADAQRYSEITYQEALSKQLRIMDAAAFSLCMDNQIPIVVFDFFKQGEMARAFRGETVGTLVHDSSESSPSPLQEAP